MIPSIAKKKENFKNKISDQHEVFPAVLTETEAQRAEGTHLRPHSCRCQGLACKRGPGMVNGVLSGLPLLLWRFSLGLADPGSAHLSPSFAVAQASEHTSPLQPLLCFLLCAPSQEFLMSNSYFLSEQLSGSAAPPEPLPWSPHPGHWGSAAADICFAPWMQLWLQHEQLYSPKSLCPPAWPSPRKERGP